MHTSLLSWVKTEMANNVAVGILRQPSLFFYEIDCKRGQFKKQRDAFKNFAESYFEYWSIYRTKHGYHLVGYPYAKYKWQAFKQRFPSDYLMKLRKRWGTKNPQVLRVSPKWNLKTGKIVSPAPKWVSGNLILEDTRNFKVLYYAK